MKVQEQNEVYQANEAFYHAFETLDIKEMEKVWVKAAHIQCIHPGWGLLKGWDSVMASWRRIFENTHEIHFLLSEVQIRIHDLLGWLTLYENITSRFGEEVVTGTVLTTNIFEKRSGGWLMTHHHGSYIVQPPIQPNPTTFH